MKFRRLDLNAIRAVQVFTALGFCYLAYRAREDFLSSDVVTAVRILPAFPFVLAFIWLTREPSASQWLTIRVVNQALATVAFAVAAVLLIGLPDTARACVYLATAGLMQWVALLAMRRTAPELPKISRGHRILRVSMVLLFAFAFLSFK